LGDFTRTSPELLAKLRLGWSLGNSLDVPNGETMWGNPRVTPELLAAVAKAGFPLVRIPVTWAQHMAELVNVNETVGFIN
jgi:endoglucanase